MNLHHPHRGLVRSARPAALAVSLVACPLLSGCFAAAAAGMGFVVSQEVLPNDVHVAQVDRDVDLVWESARETFGFLLDPGTEMTVQAFPRRLEGVVDGADVVVEVEAHDIDRTIIRVQAEKYLGSDSVTAAEVLNAILERL